MRDSDINYQLKKQKRLKLLTIIFTLTAILCISTCALAATKKKVDMSKVTLKATSTTNFYRDSYTIQDYNHYIIDESDPTFVLKLKLTDPSGHVFSSKTDTYSVALVTSKAYAGRVTLVKKKLSGSTLKLYFKASNTAKVKIRVKVNGKKFPYVTARFFKLTMTNSSLLAVGKTTQLTVYKKLITGNKAHTGTIKWTSSNPAVATVSSTGLVTARSNGNAIIYATLGQAKLGCAVSVTSQAKVDAINQAIYIAQNWTYKSVPGVRMQEGFYDCSSLTWRVLHNTVCNFGDATGAPTAGEQYAYLVKNNKWVVPFTRANEQAMVYQAGDLDFLFYGGVSSDTCTHVELMKGYEFYGFKNGKPVVRYRACKVDIYDNGATVYIGRP